MEFLFEFLLQFLGEVLLQLVFELLAEAGLHSLSEPFKTQRHPVVAGIGGYLLWGALAGAISLLVLPQSLISNALIRQANLIASPLLAGGVMALLGRRRARKGQHLVGLDRFGYAFAFALAMAVVRYLGAE